MEWTDISRTEETWHSYKLLSSTKLLRYKTHCKADQALVNALDNKNLIHSVTDETKKFL